MKAKNTTNYKFLKNFRPELYKLCVKMEEDLLITPISMLAYATRFLEYMLYDIAKDNNYEVNKDSGFVNNIYELIQLNFLEFYLGDLMIKAYVFRNTSIHNTNITKSLKEDKKNAHELNKRLFDIADVYYKNITNDYEEHLFIEPSFIEDSTQENDTLIIRQDKSFDKCIICGEPNRITKSNFCHDCDNLLNYREVLTKIITEKGTNTLLKEKDFDYPFKNQLIKDLLNKKVLEKIGNDYNIVNDNLDGYFKLTDELMEIDKFLADFIDGDIENPISSKFYNYENYPYQQVSKIIDEDYVSKIVKMLENGFSLQYALNEIGIKKSDLDTWFDSKKSEFIDGIKDELFVRYNELLIKELFRSIEKEGNLNVKNKNIDFWSQYFEGFSQRLSKKLSKEYLAAFVKLFKMNNTKQDVLNQLGISEEEFENSLSIHKRLADEYYEEIERRKGFVLVNIKEYSLIESFEKSKLDIDEFINDDSEFYHKIRGILQTRYLDYRKKGLNSKECCEKLAINHDEIISWHDDEAFRKKYEKIRLNLFKKAVNKNKTKEEILNILEISEIELNEYISLGKSGNSQYFEYYDYFENNYYKNKFKIFLEEFENKSNIPAALKKADLSQEELDDYVKSNEDFKVKLNDLKINFFVNHLIKKGKINQNALKKMDISKEEYRNLENIINQKVMEKQVDLITNDALNGKIIFKAAKDVNCNVEDVFEWIYKGSLGNEDFEELAYYYWMDVLPYINVGNESLREGKSIANLKKAIDPPMLGKYDFAYWQKWGLISRDNPELTLDSILNIIKNYNN